MHTIQIQELKCHHPKKDYTMSIHLIEFSPTSDGTDPHTELKITEPQETGWEIDVIGSKQVSVIILMCITY